MPRVGVIHKLLSHFLMLHQKTYKTPNYGLNIFQLMLILWHGNIAISMAEKFLPAVNPIQNISGTEKEWKKA